MKDGLQTGRSNRHDHLSVTPFYAGLLCVQMIFAMALPGPFHTCRAIQEPLSSTRWLLVGSDKISFASQDQSRKGRAKIKLLGAKRGSSQNRQRGMTGSVKT